MTNIHEQICFDTAKKKFENIHIVRGVCGNLQALKYQAKFYNDNGENVLFLNAANNLVTLKNNSKRVELCLSIVGYDKLIYIDAKYLSITTNLVDVCVSDIIRARDLDGELWIVLFGQVYSPDVVRYLQQYKHDKVKILLGGVGLMNELNRF